MGQTPRSRISRMGVNTPTKSQLARGESAQMDRAPSQYSVHSLGNESFRSGGKGILKSTAKKSRADPKSSKQMSRGEHLKQSSKSIRRSHISATRDNDMSFKVQKYDRPINPVRVDEIPEKGQRSQTYFTKHICPRKELQEQPRSRWADYNYDLENLTE